MEILTIFLTVVVALLVINTLVSWSWFSNIEEYRSDDRKENREIYQELRSDMYKKVNENQLSYLVNKLIIDDKNKGKSADIVAIQGSMILGKVKTVEYVPSTEKFRPAGTPIDILAAYTIQELGKQEYTTLADGRIVKTSLITEFTVEIKDNKD